MSIECMPINVVYACPILLLLLFFFKWIEREGRKEE